MKGIKAEDVNILLKWLNENKAHLVHFELYNDTKDITKPRDKYLDQELIHFLSSQRLASRQSSKKKPSKQNVADFNHSLDKPRGQQ